MRSLSQAACRLNIHHWQYETRGHAFKGFVYPVHYRTCKLCQLAQVEVMNADSAEVVWQVIENKD